MKFLTVNRLATIAATIGILAVLSRIEPAKELIYGDKKFLGIF